MSIVNRILIGALSLFATVSLKGTEPNYLKLATDFADCMIEHGRDRYGTVSSPLFAVLLTRDPVPEIGPYPIFESPAKYQWQKELSSPFRKFNYNRCLNYPPGLGGEGPHKITYYGCDLYEDKSLYEMLFNLSRTTKDSRYKTEAEAAIRWWFLNTMGPADLYPWGEHLGWDFENECPTYFKGPSKYLYGACYHEIKDEVPFIDILVSLSKDQNGPTLLERYALGVWKAHYWDQERAIYCRHGDYTGADKRLGSPDGFPAHQGAHFRLWVATYQSTDNPAIQKQLREILVKVLDVQLQRAQTHGFIPFTFNPELKGRKAKNSDQSVRLGRHALDMAQQLAEVDKALASKFDRLGKLLQVNENGSTSSRSTGIAKIKPDASSEVHAREIMRRLNWFKETGELAYLKSADQQARAAVKLFCDTNSPLPKAYPSPKKTAQGEPFPDFYFRGSKLMNAFVLLSEAKATEIVK